MVFNRFQKRIKKNSSIIYQINELSNTLTFVNYFWCCYNITNIEFGDPSIFRNTIRFLPSLKFTLEDITNNTCWLNPNLWNKLIETAFDDIPDIILEVDKFTRRDSLQFPHITKLTSYDFMRDEFFQIEESEHLEWAGKYHKKKYPIDKLAETPIPIDDENLPTITIRHLREHPEDFYICNKNSLYLNLTDLLRTYSSYFKRQVSPENYLTKRKNFPLWKYLQKNLSVDNTLFLLCKNQFSIEPTSEFINFLNIRYQEILDHLKTINEVLKTPNLEKLNKRNLKNILDFYDLDFTGIHGLTLKDKSFYDLIIILEEITTGLIVDFLNIPYRIVDFFGLTDSTETQRIIQTYYSNQFKRYSLSITDLLQRFSNYNPKKNIYEIKYIKIFPKIEQKIIKLIKEIYSLFYDNIYPMLHNDLFLQINPLIEKNNENKIKIQMIMDYFRLFRVFIDYTSLDSFNVNTEIIVKNTSEKYGLEPIITRSRYNLSNRTNLKKLLITIQYLLSNYSLNPKFLEIR